MATAQSLPRGGGACGPMIHPELGHPQWRAGGRRLLSGQEVTPCQGAHSPIAGAIEAEHGSRVHHQSANKQVSYLPRLS